MYWAHLSQDTQSRSVAVLCHEIAHMFGISDHHPEDTVPCVTSTGDYRPTSIDNPETYFCSECTYKIKSNLNKYMSDL